MTKLKNPQKSVNCTGEFVGWVCEDFFCRGEDFRISNEDFQIVIEVLERYFEVLGMFFELLGSLVDSLGSLFEVKFAQSQRALGCFHPIYTSSIFMATFLNKLVVLNVTHKNELS